MVSLIGHQVAILKHHSLGQAGVGHLWDEKSTTLSLVLIILRKDVVTMTCWRAIYGTLVVLAITACLCMSQEAVPSSSVERQSLDEAWWTGPMLAASAATLPRGHFLIEPYFYDVSVQGHYDGNGNRHSATHANGYGSLTYLLYGLADRVSVGLIPVAGLNTLRGTNSGGGMGDVSLQGQYRLTQFRPGNWIPTTSVVLQETLPTGKYDRLGARPNDGMGSGAWTTTVAFYSQKYFWLPNGRILRGRVDVSESFSSNVTVHGVSVYGTETGFSGHAQPGSSFFLDVAGEYSLTRSWVLALDVTYRYGANTRVTGSTIPDPGSGQNPAGVQLDSGSSHAFGLAPAIEYNLNRNLGLLIGVRMIPAGRNTTATITPAVAINFVH